MKLYLATLLIAIFGASCGGGDVYIENPPPAATPIPDETPGFITHHGGLRA